MGNIKIDLEKYGISPERVNKGQVITEEELTSLYKIAQENGVKTDYGRWVWGVRQYIEEFMDMADKPVVLRQKDNNIVVCQDNEASEYLHDRFNIGIATACRALRRMKRVDEKALTKDEKTRHDKSVYVMGAQVSVIEKERKRLGLLDAGMQLMARELKELPKM